MEKAYFIRDNADETLMVMETSNREHIRLLVSNKGLPVELFLTEREADDLRDALSPYKLTCHTLKETSAAQMNAA